MLLNKASKRRLGEEKAKQIKDCASGSFGIGFARDAFAFQIRQLIEQIVFLEKQIVKLEEEMRLALSASGYLACC